MRDPRYPVRSMGGGDPQSAAQSRRNVYMCLVTLGLAVIASLLPA